MTTAGPSLPGTGADSAPGTGTWTNPGNVTAEDGVFATIAGSSGYPTTHYLKGTNFGFSIPAGATIDGIIAAYKYKVSVNTGSNEGHLQLIQGGVVGGTDKAGTSINSTTLVWSADLGSASDLWGRSWTAADVNASNFGFAFAADLGTETLSVDAFRITVYYTAAGVSLPSIKVTRQAVMRAASR